SKIVLKIEWLNDSTYVLTVKKLVNAPGCLSKRDWIKTVITSCTDNRWVGTYTSNKCGSGKCVFLKKE
ncbi:MAG: hypothetical protein ACHQF2_05980, partial [Flavobacteriales bacterium]